ncbi:MAG: flagellar hook-length control protein FliK, partial [Pseudomonadota bacterium]
MTPFEALSSSPVQQNGSKGGAAHPAEEKSEGRRADAFADLVRGEAKSDKGGAGTVQMRRQAGPGLASGQDGEAARIEDAPPRAEQELRLDVAAERVAADARGADGRGAREMLPRGEISAEREGDAGSTLPALGLADGSAGKAPLSEVDARAAETLGVQNAASGKGFGDTAPAEMPAGLSPAAGALPEQPSRMISEEGARPTVSADRPGALPPQADTGRAGLPDIAGNKLGEGVPPQQAARLERPHVVAAELEGPPAEGADLPLRVMSRAADAPSLPTAPPALALPDEQRQMMPMAGHLPGADAAVGADLDAAVVQEARGAELRSLTVPGAVSRTPALAGLMPQLVAQISTNQANAGGQEIEIRLDPPELGRVRISFSGVEGAMTGLVLAERAEVDALMRRNADQLA